MLDKNDLSQIRSLFKEELKPIHDRLDKVERQFTPINKQLKKLQDGQNIILKYVDSQDSGLEKRVERIENHLGLPQPL